MSQTKAQLLQGASDQSVTFNDATVSTLNTGALSGTRNRIINGAMEIDQRNSGASTSLNNTSAYTVDRWNCAAQGGAGTGTATVQGVTNDAPPGFKNSLKYTVTNAKAVSAATDSFYIYQPIEGYNVIDLAFGTALAKTLTLSFWVKCSLTGTFSGHVRAASGYPAYTFRTYVYTYTINAANTWEYKTITIPGDTGAAINLNENLGLSVLFNLGSGSNQLTSSTNTWLAQDAHGSTSSVRLIGTLNATFQVTGVQLETGSVATPFERRSYGQELALCQRYYYQISGNGSTRQSLAVGMATTNAIVQECVFVFPVEMRIAPAANFNDNVIYMYRAGAYGDYTATSPSLGLSSRTRASLQTSTGYSDLTIGAAATYKLNNGTASYVSFNAEF